MKKENPDKVPLIEFFEVRKSFGESEVLKGVNLSIYEGETVAIIGSSGCGKTVLMKLLVGLLPLDSGSISIRGEKVSEFNTEEEWNRVRLKIGFLFQGSALYDSMSVEENIAFPLRHHTKLSEDEIKERVKEKLKMVNLKGIEDKMPLDISGGMQKRIALARAIVMDPEIIIYDEPTTGLDPITSEVISTLIFNFKEKLSVTSILVTHDMSCVYRVADRVAMLEEGRIIAEGTVKDIKVNEDKRVRQFIHR